MSPFVAARSALLAVLAAAACRAPAPASLPLLGPVPASILVAPAVGPDGSACDAAVLAGADAGLRACGYRTTALAVGLQLFADRALALGQPPTAAELARVGEQLGVDAVLQVTVADIDAGGRGRPARWDVAWRLWSTRGSGLLWEFSDRGAYRRPAASEDPMRGVDDDALRAVTVGDDAQPAFRGTEDLADWLHRTVLQRLQARAPSRS